MSKKIFLSTTGNGIARARQTDNGDWQRDDPIQGQQINCLAADPNNARVIYAGSQGEGVYRSDDSGETWAPAGLAGEFVKSLAVSPHDADIIYAGTRPAHMHISRDGGKSWEELPGFQRIPGRWWWFSPAESPYQAYVQSIGISPNNPDVLLAGIEFGAVVRSQDGGQTWSGHRKGSLRDNHSLTFHQTKGDWAYQAGGSGGGASFSQDGGMTWHKYTSGLAKNYGVSCAADSQKPEVWYVSVAPGPGKAYGVEAEAYLYRASGGAEWQPIGWEPHPLSSMPIALLTSPTDAGQLYAGLTNGEVWHSSDYGDTWQKMPFTLPPIRRSMILIEPTS
jgi:photosystem II stability/assembly factor-like uncharacterized protein